MSEINVTPFVDVMLVLLIVFMVTAPLLTVGVKVDLPKTEAPSMKERRSSRWFVTVDNRMGKPLYPGRRDSVELETLAPRLRAITDNNPDARIFVRGDKAIHYGRVMEVMGAINQAGFRRAALVTELPKKARKAAEKNEAG